MEQIGIPELSSDEIEALCSIAEKAAREHVLLKVSPKKVETIDIWVETEGTKPISITVEVNLSLSPSVKKINAQRLADEAVKEALTSAENYLRELACHSKK